MPHDDDGNLQVRNDPLTVTEMQFRFRSGMTLTVAMSHIVLACLGLFGRLSYSIPSRYPLILDVMNSTIWVWLHLIVGVVLIISLALNKKEVSALAASTGVMGAWSFLSMLWGLSTVDSPVSLTGPTMGAMITILSYLLTQSWARSGDRDVG